MADFALMRHAFLKITASAELRGKNHTRHRKIGVTVRTQKLISDTVGEKIQSC